MRAGIRVGSLRSRLFVGIAATAAVCVVVTVVAGALLTRRSLEHDALRSLARQVDLIAAQDTRSGVGRPQLGRFLATEQERLAVVTPTQAELLLPPRAAVDLRHGAVATGSLDVHGERFLFAARRSGGDAFVLLRSAQSQRADWTPFLLGLGLAGLVGAALAAIVALLLARAVANPLTRVAEASLRLAAGQTPERLEPKGSDEVRALAASFNHLADELERAQEAERAFLLSVSHELKTPLTAIRGHAEAMADGVMEPARASVVIEREARRLERLIRDLLELARLRRRAFSVQRSVVDLREVAEETVARYEAPARGYGVSLDAVCGSPSGALADLDRTVQALSNLVENALRSTPRGGSVRIVCGPARLEVVDDGPGIREEDLAHAFERFYLYDRYEGERTVGTGLGLAIVHELVTAMGGSVEAASTPHVGSTFSILLPSADLPEAGAATGVGAGAASVSDRGS